MSLEASLKPQGSRWAMLGTDDKFEAWTGRGHALQILLGSGSGLQVVLGCTCTRISCARSWPRVYMNVLGTFVNTCV